MTLQKLTLMLLTMDAWLMSARSMMNRERRRRGKTTIDGSA